MSMSKNKRNIFFSFEARTGNKIQQGDDDDAVMRLCGYANDVHHPLAVLVKFLDRRR
jgi:hypothetical protein